MLTRLAIKNFKSIGEGLNETPGLTLDLKPLTFLVGPNGSGKSSVLEALAFAAQKCNTDGELVAYKSMREVLHKKDVNIRGSVEGTLPVLVVGRIRWSSPGFRFVFYAQSAPELSYLTDGVPISGGVDPRRSAVSPEITKQLEGDFFNKVYFLKGVRGIERGPANPRNAVWVGPHGETTLHILNLLNKGEYREMKSQVQFWAERFGIRNISGFVEGASLDADYEDSVLNANLPLRASSFGSAQVLPIIVQSFWTKPGQIIMIEEPEISLHPQAQVDMAELLATAAAEGKQILATTHSTFMLLGLSEAVRKKIISADKIAIYETEKTNKGTTATSLPVTEKGYIKGGVPSFAKVEKRLMRDFLKSLPKE